MTLLIGTARFTGPRSVDVQLRDGGVRALLPTRCSSTPEPTQPCRRCLVSPRLSR
jgi:hypothetical protein